ncbi:polyphosphate kinase 2 family protein [Demequina activiva]|uniref:Polyphosphate kinase n=1 Tax=Demequina activiva TaxID=1582364 RepID=A0A919UGP9_9MICO|nr:polyphosphate kinase 2 family protein [Demequina activiva]GIG54669.1 polyphosphate kinase [Demequina activiva]
MGKRSHWREHPAHALRVDHGFRLESFDAAATPGFEGAQKHAERLMERRGADLAELQERLYAHGRAGGDRSMLLVLQGMDTAGKGGIVRHVLGMVDPQGVASRGFGVPTEEERAHHFLWRIDRALPQAGRIGVFDRSHYEDVLVVRVHGLVPEAVWQGRYSEINEWEAQVAERGTTIVKCALMVSPEEQLNRIEERLERPDKHWKYNPGDLDERAHWPAYMEAYQAVLDRTSTPSAPWHVIPADNKWYARLAVTELLASALESLELGWPQADFDVQAERERIARLRSKEV